MYLLTTNECISYMYIHTLAKNRLDLELVNHEHIHEPFFFHSKMNWH